MDCAEDFDLTVQDCFSAFADAGSPSHIDFDGLKKCVNDAKNVYKQCLKNMCLLSTGDDDDDDD